MVMPTAQSVTAARLERFALMVIAQMTVTNTAIINAGMLMCASGKPERICILAESFAG